MAIRVKGLEVTKEVPINKAAIRTLIPHSGFMCLLDRVIEWDDQSIICLSSTHREAANPLRRQGHLSAVHAFEYGAQATAVHGGLRARAAGVGAPPGYLAALRDVHLHVARLDDVPSPLLVCARRLFGDSANTIYESRILADGAVLAEGHMTIILRSM
jgi:predicted hotdog family 3-hydroxylacyl-ACP dehydratase